jgi:drug/metabolite transporter (DMT)-like permease
MDNQPKKKSGALIVFLSSLLWAGDAPFRKPLLTGGLSVSFIALLEHILNTLACLPGLIRHRLELKGLGWRQWLGFIYIGAGASALAAILFVQAAVVMNYNFTVAALLQKFQPIFAILFAGIFLKEKMQIKFWLLAIPALFGGYLVTFGLASPNLLWHSGSINILGAALALLAAALWAGGTVVWRSLLKGLNFQVVNGMRFVFGFIFLFGFMAVVRGFQFGLMTPVFWRNSLIIALLTGFFALLLYYYGLKSTKASIATLMELGYPLALTVVNWKFLGITLNVWQIAGALLLLVSVTIFTLSQNSGVE